MLIVSLPCCLMVIRFSLYAFVVLESDELRVSLNSGLGNSSLPPSTESNWIQIC